MERPTVVAGAIIRNGDLFLIVKGRFDGFWGFPSWEAESEAEPDEDIRPCLGKEIKEELGIEVFVDDEFSMIRYGDGAGNVMHLHSFLCQFLSGEPKPRTHADARWVTIEDFAKFEFVPTDIPVVRQLEFKFCHKVPIFFGGTKDQHLAAARMVIETLRKSFRARGIPDDGAELSCPRCEEVIGIVTDDALPEKMVFHELARCSIKHPPN